MRRFLSIVALASAGLSAFAAGDTTLPLRRLGLYIGSNDGGPGRATLRYAEEDAGAMAGVMKELGGVSGEDSLVLLAPTAGDVQLGFRQARQRAQAVRDSSRRVELLVYYSGHSDEQGLLLGGEKFGYAELKEAIQEVRADVNIAILDSCSSGAFTRLKGGTRQPPFLVDESSSMQGHAYISSSSADEASQESDLIKGSFFTYFLISGLRGAADSTRDGQVSLNEAYHFAFNETLALTENTQGGAQHPSYNIQLTGTGDLTLTDLRAAVCTLNFAQGIQGRLFVRNASGRLVAELAKESGAVVGLGLPEGQYRVVLEEGQRLYEATVEVRPGRPQSLGLRQFTAVRRQPTVARGEGGSGAEASAFPQDTLDPEQGFWQRAEKWFNRDARPAPSAGDPFADFLADESWGAIPPADPAGALAGAASDPSAAEPGTAEPPAAIASAQPEPTEPPAPTASDTEVPPAASASGPDSALPPDVRRVPVAVSLLPAVSSAGPERRLITLSLNLLAGSAWAIHGAEFGAMLNFTEREVRGLQMAGVGNLLQGDLVGYQAAGVFNFVAGQSRAFQSAGVANLVRGDAGFLQTAGVFNIDQGAFRGLQAAGVFNLGGGRASGLQAAGVFNLLEGPLAGAQVAGVFNRATSVTGAQVGLVNIGGDVRGSQVGLINVATGEVWGAQVGLVNISREIHGLPLGLVSISKNGGFGLSAYYAEGNLGYVGLQMSSGLVYTVLYGGARLGSPELYSAGLGLGLHLPMGPFYADLDLGIQSAYEPTEPIAPPFPAARLLVGWKVLQSLSLFGGILLNGHIPGSTQLTPLHTGVPLHLQFANGSLELYPKLTAGVSFWTP